MIYISRTTLEIYFVQFFFYAYINNTKINLPPMVSFRVVILYRTTTRKGVVSGKN